MADPKWSDDAFLDDLRRQADPLADSTVARLADEHGLQSLNTLFPRLLTDVDLDVEEIPGPAREFFETTRRRCGDFDSERLERGAFAFRGHAFAAAIVMLASSLPSGYAAPCLARILTVSGNLQNHPFRRLMGVLQLVVQVMAKGSSAAESQAHLTARKLRLLHAGIRRIVPRFRPEYIDRFGPPVNHEDMLATVMGFSHLVVEGIQKLGRHLSEDEADDIWFLWRYFCLDMGIHPEGRPDDPSLIPETRDDAAAFYRSYARRHFAGAAENPDGVELARINLDMMEAMIPAWKRGIGFRRAPQLVMMELLGEEGMRRVGVEPLDGHGGQVAHLGLILRISQGVPPSLKDRFAAALSPLLFQGIINVSRKGEVTFVVPENLDDVRTRLV